MADDKKINSVDTPAVENELTGRTTSGGVVPFGSSGPSAGCLPPEITYEDLVGKTQHERLMFMRSAYNARLASCTGGTTADEDARAGFQQAVANLNDALVDVDDGIPTTQSELFTSFYGPTRDELDPRTRRSQPFGTVITDMDGYEDNIPVTETDPAEDFEEKIVDDTPTPDFTGIEYVASTVTPKQVSEGITRALVDFADPDSRDEYSEEHESCLTELPCVFEEPTYKLDTLTEIPVDNIAFDEPEKLNIDLDVEILDEDITSGCANGTGLFDKLMTAIDSSIDLQFKSSRLDNKTFGEFYASTISAAMQQTTQFLVQKEQLELDKAKVEIAIAEFNLKNLAAGIDNKLKIEKAKYDIALLKYKTLQAKHSALLTKAQTADVLLGKEERKQKIPLELSILTQQARAEEKKVELTARQIEESRANIISMYNTIGEGNATGIYQREQMKTNVEKTKKDIAELTANGVLNRNLTEAKIEQARVGVKTAKFDTLLKKYQAYGTKVATEESKATGASNRRLTSADIQSKNKQASLYDQQRKTYIYGQRAEVLNIMKDMWNTQIDTLGPEGMAVEAIKGPELSSRLERAALDVGA